MTGRIVDLFAGLGGWTVGLGVHGLDDYEVGLEWDAAACATRAAAGHLTIRADVAAYPAERFRGSWGLIASPPCQDFSAAGKKAGRMGARGALVDVVPRWVDVIRPEWVALEQVPSVLPIWQEFAADFATLGYSTWTGILNSADFGVPQTRRRAILLASRSRQVQPPAPTHTKEPSQLSILDNRAPWVTMAHALGWSAGSLDRRQSSNGQPVRLVPTHEPAPTLTAIAGSKSQWVYRRPATTIVSSFCPDVVAAPGYRTKVSRQDAEGSVRITLEDALTLQGFDPTYPVQGSRSKRFEQVGNAIPPGLAAALVEAVTA